ncbi:MAG TPA: biotin/lipoyl-binding protein [Candidatus Limnocylindrales bacterium]|nr:biotin/lipoyl-binding protein [Candidatus Limnocylindrales bacterium]
MANQGVPRPKISPLPRRTGAAAWLSGGRAWIAGLGAVALILIGLIARDLFFPPAATAAALRLATVTRGTVSTTVTGTGSLVAGSQVNVGFRVPGQLIEIDVKVGDTVKTGQVLARIDPSVQQAALAQAQAQLASAQANLQAAQSPLTSAQVAQLQHSLSAAQQSYNDTVAQVDAQNQADAATVASDQARVNTDCSTTPPAQTCTQDQTTLAADQSRQHLDQINNQGRINSASAQLTAARDSYAVQTQVKPNAVTSAQAGLVSAQAQVQAAQLALNETTLTAPSSGLIVSLNGEIGEQAATGGGTTAQAPGTTAPAATSGTSSSASGSGAFAVISDQSQYYAVVPFAESDAAGLQPNQIASLSFDAVPNLTISGHLLAVAPTATVTSNVINYYASFVLNRLDPRLRAGMTVNAAVTTASVDNVLYVPNAAVRSANGTTTVTVLNKGEQLPTEVVVGLQGDTNSEIKAGLNEGQQVVLPTIRAATGTTGGGRGLLGGGGFGGGVTRGGGG